LDRDKFKLVNDQELGIQDFLEIEDNLLPTSSSFYEK
jgi:hypothetical protein